MPLSKKKEIEVKKFLIALILWFNRKKMMLSVDKITEILRLGFDVDKLKSSLCKPFISLRYHRKVSIDHAGCE